jgi:alkylation response protein AidB-like acyl-CoA dehydrogenase
MKLPESKLLNPAGYPPEFLRGLLRSGAFRDLFREGRTARDKLTLVRECAGQSVELALSLGITTSLFTDPVRRHAPGLWRGQLAEGFLSGGMLGGMMITEPGCGTDLTACETQCRIVDGGWEITGTKHWAGLSGLADYWLVLARDDEEGRARRFPSLNFHICRADPESFRLVKRYGSAGLRSIPYGKTEIRARAGVLGPLLTGSRAERFRRIHGLLQRSRISIAAITAGACDRIAREVGAHVRDRRVFGLALSDYGQVRVRVAEIEAARDICDVLFEIACREVSKADDSGDDVPALTANAVKVVCTDLAFAVANSASQLLGGESYRTDTYIGRAAADLRPFRIFEGSNDVLCDAIWQAAEKSLKQGGESFSDRMLDTYRAAGRTPPDPGPFTSAAPGESRPQGLRCLGGRMLAHALCLRWCEQQGLSADARQPLFARMDRDLHTAATWGDHAGLAEY